MFQKLLIHDSFVTFVTKNQCISAMMAFFLTEIQGLFCVHYGIGTYNMRNSNLFYVPHKNYNMKLNLKDLLFII